MKRKAKVKVLSSAKRLIELFCTIHNVSKSKFGMFIKTTFPDKLSYAAYPA
jgi:hypothetical protein